MSGYVRGTAVFDALAPGPWTFVFTCPGGRRLLSASGGFEDGVPGRTQVRYLSDTTAEIKAARPEAGRVYLDHVCAFVS